MRGMAQFFDYYVFQTNGDPLALLAPGVRGLMGAPGPKRVGADCGGPRTVLNERKGPN